jgi:hypothetical protein
MPEMGSRVDGVTWRAFRPALAFNFSVVSVAADGKMLQKIPSES